MRYLIFIVIYSILFLACSKPKSKIEKLESTASKDYFIEGVVKNFRPNTAYLNKIIENSLYTIDSASIKNNRFQFNGSVIYPERFALTFNNYSSVTPLIIENDSIKITIDFETIESPTIDGSNLNREMNDYIASSKIIFKKIEYLFPKFQKARLENDVEQLNLLNDEMTVIENEYYNFTYDYVKNNSTSIISAMILRDQLKLSKIDTTRIVNAYNLLSNDVKKTPDAEIIAIQLNLH
jgi:hypothetical protein